MPDQKPLGLHEEILLLVLSEQRGIVASGTHYEFGLAAGILAELLLHRRIQLGSSEKKEVHACDSSPTGDAAVDECLKRIANAGSPTTLGGWAAQFAGDRKFKDRVAAQLCRRGILRIEEERILLLFTREVYPELDPKPELEIRERLRRAIFTDATDLDPKTGILVSLADHCKILPLIFPAEELKARKERLAQLRTGEMFGQAAAEAIAYMYTMLASHSAAAPMMTMMMTSD